jgi:alcohol dehydrogenase
MPPLRQLPPWRVPALWGATPNTNIWRPGSMVLPVPVGLDPVVTTLFNPLGAGMRWGIMVTCTEPGDVAVTAQAPTAFTPAIAPARPAGTVAVAYRPALDLPRPGRYPCASKEPRNC